MKHSEWIRSKFKKMSEDLGFLFTPREEIENRLARVRASMRKSEIEALLVIQKMDQFYLSGTSQDALLFVPLEGLPLLFVRRELERAKVESPLDHVVAVSSLRDYPLLIKDHHGRLPRSLGLELDVLPVKDYFRYQGLFPGTEIVDSSPIFRDVRKVKSPFEIGLVRTAGAIAKKVYDNARLILKEGMTEIEFGSLLDAVAKRYGHEGLLRIRLSNYEAYSWFVVSGLAGGIVSQSDSPIGGLGLSPAFPVGASRKVIKAHEPILLDLGICYHGYQSDQTRMYCIGEMPRKFINAYNACKEIHDAVLEDVRPGADAEALFLKTLVVAEKLGYKDSYLGPPGLQTRFIGHGIGLELSELPFLAQGQSYPLEEGMVFAVEPKITFPGEGGAGLENTLVVTHSGYEILTPLENTIFQV